MAHPQNSNRGLLTVKNIEVPVSGGILFDDYSTSTELLTSDSTGVVIAGSVKVGDAATALLTADTTGVVFSADVKLSNQANARISGNSTGIVTNAQIKVANKKYLSANSTGWIFSTVAAAPDARSSAKVTFLTDSTGNNAVMINTTGTTWKYLNVTSERPS